MKTASYHCVGRWRGFIPLALALILSSAGCGQESATNEATPAKARPVATELTGDAANCPPPRGWRAAQEGQVGRVEGPANIVILTKADELLWNGDPIELAQLGQYLEVTAQMEPEPMLVLRPDSRASCELMSRVVAATVVAGLRCEELCRFELTKVERE